LKQKEISDSEQLKELKVFKKKVQKYNALYMFKNQLSTQLVNDIFSMQ